MVSLVCPCCSWLVLAPKVLQLCTNHHVLVLCRSVWVSEACQLFLVPFRSSNTPLYPSKVLRAKERASTPYSSIIFCLGFTFESLKELGVHHKRPIPPNEIGGWVWCPIKEPWIDSWDLGPIMSPHTCIFLGQNLPKEIKRKRKEVLSKWDKNVDERHMKTKCPMQPVRFPREEDHRYASCFEIKPHPKNVWKSPENPLTHPKCVSHLWPKCSPKESLCLKRSLMNSKACILTLWP
jgi:hypothetical protein